MKLITVINFTITNEHSRCILRFGQSIQLYVCSTLYRLNLSVVQSPVHRMLALKAALQSMVLLKNDEIGGLPLGTVEKACVSFYIEILFF